MIPSIGDNECIIKDGFATDVTDSPLGNGVLYFSVPKLGNLWIAKTVSQTKRRLSTGLTDLSIASFQVASLSWGGVLMEDFY